MLLRAALMLLFLGLFTCGADVRAQGDIVVVRGDHAVDGSGPNLPLTEPYVAVNPSDPQHLVAGAIVAPTGQDTPWRCAVFTSRDGGASWQRHDFAMERCIDPWVVFTPGDAILFTGIEIRSDREGDERFRLVAYRSEDGGRTWPAEPVSLGRAHDHELLTIAPDGPIYLTSRRMRRTPEGYPRHRLYVARSVDDGRSFQDLAELAPSNLSLTATGIVLLPDGTLYITYDNSQRNVDDFSGAGTLATSLAWGLRSEDGGQTFSEPLFITGQCASGAVAQVFPGYPFLAVDASDGPYRGRLYHACIRPGVEGVALATSSDGGDVWADPVRVDPPPEDGPAHARTPMLAVNRDGVVGVAWYDRRHDPDRRCQDVYFTASYDGGATFLKPLRISTETSCPDGPGNGRAGQSWPMGGDYSSLTTGPDGLFHLLWADSRSHLFQLRHAAIRVTQDAEN